jgi:hypothetical protein
MEPGHVSTSDIALEQALISLIKPIEELNEKFFQNKHEHRLWDVLRFGREKKSPFFSPKAGKREGGLAIVISFLKRL